MARAYRGTVPFGAVPHLPSAVVAELVDAQR